MPSTTPPPDNPPKKKYRPLYEDGSDYPSSPPPPSKCTPAKSTSQRKAKNAARKKRTPKKKDQQPAETDGEPGGQTAVDVPPKKKYLRLYADVSDDFSSPPSPKHKSQSAGGSKKAAGKKRAATPDKRNALGAESDEEAINLDGPVVVEHVFSPAKTPVGKVSKSRARTRTRRRSTVTTHVFSDNEIVDDPDSDSDVSDVVEDDTPLDGRGDPNLSTIAPPLPMNLIEPTFQGHETGYHVVTAGTAVGISAFRGVAESRLNCEMPSMATFTSWTQAKAYYIACFEADSVHIRKPRPAQTPTHSPARKKQKISPLPRQPNFAPSGLLPPNRLDHEISATTQPSFALSQNRLDHEISATAQPSIAPQATATPTPSPQIFIPRPRRIFVEDSSDDGATATAGNHQLRYPKLRGPPPSTPLPAVESNRNPPAALDSRRPVIIITDSEEEEFTAVKVVTDRDLPRRPALSNPQGRASSSRTIEVSGNSAASNAALPTFLIPDSDEEFEFDPDTQRELNRLYCIQNPGPPPRGHYRL